MVIMDSKRIQPIYKRSIPGDIGFIEVENFSQTCFEKGQYMNKWSIDSTSELHKTQFLSII